MRARAHFSINAEFHPTRSGSFRLSRRDSKSSQVTFLLRPVGLYVLVDVRDDGKARQQKTFEPIWQRGLQCSGLPRDQATTTISVGNREDDAQEHQEGAHLWVRKASSATPIGSRSNSRRFMRAFPLPFYVQVLKRFLAAQPILACRGRLGNVIICRREWHGK